MSEYDDDTRRDFEAQMDQLGARLEIVGAQREALWHSLSGLVEYVKRVGGYMTQPDQNTLREAMALLEEVSSADSCR